MKLGPHTGTEYLRSTAVRDGRKSAKLGRAIEWWYATAVKHSLADDACDRAWSCSCGPCQEGRAFLGVSTHYGVLNYGAARQSAYANAMKEGA